MNKSILGLGFIGLATLATLRGQASSLTKTNPKNKKEEAKKTFTLSSDTVAAAEIEKSATEFFEIINDRVDVQDSAYADHITLGFVTPSSSAASPERIKEFMKATAEWLEEQKGGKWESKHLVFKQAGGAPKLQRLWYEDRHSISWTKKVSAKSNPNQKLAFHVKQTAIAHFGIDPEAHTSVSVVHEPAAKAAVRLALYFPLDAAEEYTPAHLQAFMKYTTDYIQENEGGDWTSHSSQSSKSGKTLVMVYFTEHPTIAPRRTLK